MQPNPQQPALPSRITRFIRLLIFSSLALPVVFVALMNLTSLADAQSSPSGVPPSTHILQNRSERDQRLQDRNQLLYSGSSSTNSTTTTLVPSDSSVSAPDAGTNAAPQSAPPSRNG